MNWNLLFSLEREKGTEMTDAILQRVIPFVTACDRVQLKQSTMSESPFASCDTVPCAVMLFGLRTEEYQSSQPLSQSDCSAKPPSLPTPP